MQWYIHSILFVVVINILQEQMKKNHSKIDHVELLKDSLSYCTVHIVRWNIMWNVFFLMESRTLTVSDFLFSLWCYRRSSRSPEVHSFAQLMAAVRVTAEDSTSSATLRVFMGMIM